MLSSIKHSIFNNPFTISFIRHSIPSVLILIHSFSTKQLSPALFMFLLSFLWEVVLLCLVYLIHRNIRKYTEISTTQTQFLVQIVFSLFGSYLTPKTCILCSDFTTITDLYGAIHSLMIPLLLIPVRSWKAAKLGMNFVISADILECVITIFKPRFSTVKEGNLADWEACKLDKRIYEGNKIHVKFSGEDNIEIESDSLMVPTGAFWRYGEDALTGYIAFTLGEVKSGRAVWMPVLVLICRVILRIVQVKLIFRNSPPKTTHRDNDTNTMMNNVPENITPDDNSISESCADNTSRDRIMESDPGNKNEMNDSVVSDCSLNTAYLKLLELIFTILINGFSKYFEKKSDLIALKNGFKNGLIEYIKKDKEKRNSEFNSIFEILSPWKSFERRISDVMRG